MCQKHISWWKDTINSIEDIYLKGKDLQSFLNDLNKLIIKSYSHNLYSLEWIFYDYVTPTKYQHCLISWKYISRKTIESDIKLSKPSCVDTTYISFRVAIRFKWIAKNCFSYIAILMKPRLPQSCTSINGFRNRLYFFSIDCTIATTKRNRLFSKQLNRHICVFGGSIVTSSINSKVFRVYFR